MSRLHKSELSNLSKSQGEDTRIYIGVVAVENP